MSMPEENAQTAPVTSGNPSQHLTATTPTGMPPKRTAEEQSFIDVVARSHGKDWAEAHAELILDQARAIGDLLRRRAVCNC